MTSLEHKGLPNNSPPPPLPVDDFRHTDDYRRYLVKYIDPASLMSLRVVDKAWQIVGLVKGGSLLVHGGEDVDDDSDPEDSDGGSERLLETGNKNVTDVIFLLNFTTIGDNACCY